MLLLPAMLPPYRSSAVAASAGATTLLSAVHPQTDYTVVMALSWRTSRSFDAGRSARSRRGWYSIDAPPWRILGTDVATPPMARSLSQMLPSQPLSRSSALVHPDSVAECAALRRVSLFLLGSVRFLVPRLLRLAIPLCHFLQLASFRDYANQKVLVHAHLLLKTSPGSDQSGAYHV